MSRRYYTLVASLPALPDFESAEILPIGRERLNSRLRMLDPDDLADLQRVRRLVGWREYPATRTDEQVAAMYRAVLSQTKSRTLRDFTAFRIGMRVAVAGLRRRRRGLGHPAGVAATFTPIARRVVTNWEVAEFGLGAMFPWLDDARQDLEHGRAYALETRLMRAVWNHLRRLADRHHPFSFERVYCYVNQWSILNRRLSYDAIKADERFQELISEVTRDQQQLLV